MLSTSTPHLERLPAWVWPRSRANVSFKQLKSLVIMLREMPSSGVYTASAPTERPARVAMYPDAPPCVSTTNTRRRDDDADWRKVSQYSVRELRHVSLPSEYSVPGTLLLIVAGNSTMGIF